MLKKNIQKSLKRHFSDFKKIDYFIILFIVIVGFSLRMAFLAERPLHHDESLHGIYSLYYYNNPDTGYYKYNPLLHGPFLYHMIPWFYYFFGVSKLSMRLPAAFIGTLLIFLPLLFRRYWKKEVVYFLMFALALSPSLIFWSRFIRHDSFVILGIIISVFSFLKLKNHWQSIFFAIGVAIQFATKENSFIHLTFILVFIIFYFLIEFLCKRKIQIFAYKPQYIFTGILAFAFVFCFYYSSEFRYSEGIIDGLYKKSLIYWLTQHSIERITGPFSYITLIISFFESWFLPLIFIHLFSFYRKNNHLPLYFFLSSILTSILVYYFVKDFKQSYFIFRVLKLKIGLDSFLFFPLVTHAIIFTTVNLIKKKIRESFLGYLFFASLFTYSYVGEKVPWLAVYPIITGLFFFADFFKETTINKYSVILFIIITSHTLVTLTWTNFTHSYSDHNILGQVHTTKEFEDKMLELREKLDRYSHLHFLAYKGHTWPTTFYMYQSPQYHFVDPGNDFKKYTYILTDQHEQNIIIHAKNQFKSEVLPLRHWWLPDYNQINFKNYFNYFLFKKTWNPSGSLKLRLHSRISEN